MGFTESDREALAQLVFDPTCEPSYELLKACLVWPDERPSRISQEGYRLLCDVWIVRGFLHRKTPREEWGFNPPYFEEVWKSALLEIPRWPGFKRLELSPADQAYLDKSVSDAATCEVY
jgi:hypothetical protein